MAATRQKGGEIIRFLDNKHGNEIKSKKKEFYLIKLNSSFSYKQAEVQMQSLKNVFSAN